MSRSFEQLERRSLLSAAVSVTVDHLGILQVVGTDSGDTVAITTADSTLTTVINGQTFAVPAANVSGIIVKAGDGADSVGIDANTPQPATLLGEAGNDTLSGGLAATTLRGGFGSDSLIGAHHSDTTVDFSDMTASLTASSSSVTYAGLSDVDHLGGADQFISGSGDDRIFFNGNYKYVDGGAGNDVINVANGVLPTLHGGDGDDQLTAPYCNLATLYGDAGNDTLYIYRSSGTTHEFYGGTGTDTIDLTDESNEYISSHVTLDDVANDGNSSDYNFALGPYHDNIHSDIERVIGGAGNDYIVGSSANETLVGGGGNDTLIGNGGNDSLDGGLDDDHLTGSTGNDTISPGYGNDTVTGGGGDDTFVHSGLPSWLIYSHSKATITGTDGDDQISVILPSVNFTQLTVTRNGETFTLKNQYIQKFVINADAGNDLLDLRQLHAYSTVNGGDGNDTIYGGGIPSVQSGYDAEIFGDAGNDSLIGSDQPESLYGGDGDDTILGGAAAEDLDGGDGNDSIAGSGGNDSIFGDAGINTLLGGDGDDVITSNNPADTFDGGTGNNTVIEQYPGAPTTVIGPPVSIPPTQPTQPTFGVTYTLVNGVLTINGTADNDQLRLDYHATSGGNIVLTNKGYVAHHWRLADVKSILINAGAGDDTINLASLSVAAKLYGGAGADNITGGYGNDRIYGGDGNDWIDGGAGNDILYGQDGNDRLFGSAGTDHLEDNNGVNVLRGGDGRDMIVARKTDDLHANIGDVIAII